jgi:ABC-type sugar transport system substrate-binding protein
VSVKRRLFALFLLFAISVDAAAYTVFFINPGRSDEPYWVGASQGMQMAARSLGITLDIHYAERSPARVLEIAKEVTGRVDKPAYLVYPNEYGLGGEVLKLASAAGIKTFFAYSTLPEAEYGKPRERYSKWIGSLVPDVEEAGFLTSRALITRGLADRRVAPDGKLHLLIIAGDKSTPSSVLRTQGALRAAKREPAVIIDEIIYADFDQQKAREGAADAFQAHRDAKLVWAGSDLMALGAMEALEKQGRVAGRDVLFSAINTSRQAMQSVQNGRLAVLAGGHFMAGAWALVMIDDYHRGKDFANEGLTLTKPMFVLFTPDLAKRYLAQFDSGLKTADFRIFSKATNANIGRYDFRFDRLLRQVR